MRSRFARVALACALFASLTLPATAPAGPAPGPVYLKAAGLTGGGVTPLATSVVDADPLPPSPVIDSLDAQGESTLYAVSLQAGSRLELSLEATGGTLDVYLFGPGLGTLASATALAHASSGDYPRTLTYDVPPDLSGTHYIEIYAYEDSGDYSLSWLVRDPSERVRVDVGAASAITAPHTDNITIPDQLQANRVYRFYAGGSKRIQVDMAGPVGADFDLYLYAPGTTTILPKHVVPIVSANEKTATERIIYDVPASAFGTYYLEVLRFSGTGPAAVQITVGAIPAKPATTRIAGPDRYQTATTISRASFPLASDAVVLCSGKSFPDGLAASSLAGALRAPILLTAPTTLPDEVGREIVRLGATRVYIIGGTAAVGFAVERRLLTYRPDLVIQRVAGATRYETAGEVADWVHEISGVRPTRVFLASGESFPDALALSPLAFATGTPILLTQAHVIPTATSAAVTRLRGSAYRTIDIVVAGGTSAVDTPCAQQTRILAGGSLVRASGENRYETALAIAEMAVFAGWADPDTVAVASGVSFPDALGGAPLPGNREGVLLLCPVSDLGEHSKAYLQSFDFAVTQAWVLGGTAAVTNSVVTQIADILPDSAHNYTY